MYLTINFYIIHRKNVIQNSSYDVGIQICGSTKGDDIFRKFHFAFTVRFFKFTLIIGFHRIRKVDNMI